MFKKTIVFVSDDLNEISELYQYLTSCYLANQGVRVKISELSDGERRCYFINSKQKWFASVVEAGFIYINEHRENFKKLYVSSKDQTRMKSIATIPVNVVPDEAMFDRTK